MLGQCECLVVEDHAKLALTIAAVLRREGMAADVAFDGQRRAGPGRASAGTT